MFVKLVFLIVFFVMMIGVGLYSRKHASNVNDFVLGGRSVGPWLTAFAYGTSYFSAVVFVGYAGQFGYKYGLASTWIGIGNALIGSLLAWVVLGRRTRIMSNHLAAATMPDFFGKRYQSNALRIAASVISFVFLIPYTASVYNGLSRLFGMAFDIPYEVCVMVMAALTCVYVMLGGYMATAINDFIQGMIMLGGIAAVVAAVLNGQGGFLNAVQSLAEFESDVAVTAGQKGAFTSFFGPDPLNLLGVIILTSLGTWGLPQMIHKFYAIKDEKSIQSGTVISTFFAIVVSGGCYFLGGFGRLFDTAAIHKEDGSVIFDAIIPAMLSTLPDLYAYPFDLFYYLFGRAGFVSAEIDGTVYRAAYGHLLGRACGSVSGTVFVRAVLETGDACCCLGKLCVRDRHYGVKPVFVLYCFPDQCRGSRYGGRARNCPGCQPADAWDGQTGVRTDLYMPGGTGCSR